MTQCCYIYEDGVDRDFVLCDEGGRCALDAEYAVWDGLEPNYDHITEACTMHVGSLFNDTGKANHFYPLEWERVT